MKDNLLINLKLKVCFLIFMIIAGFGVIQAQTLTVKGTVTGNDGGPLPGATVLVKGTTSGVVTDFDGKYEIQANTNDVLVFSFIGYTTKEVVVGTDTTINVVLIEDAAALEEVVVIGYGTQRKSEAQGAIARVKAEDLTKVNTSDVGTALQGQIAGVNVAAASGQPGQNAVILIRGVNSVNGSNEPLFVVDGIIQQDNPQLSPDEIETVDVIKDAAHAAVYGTRGSNGVIEITTKRGRLGRMQVDVNSIYGQRKILSGVPLLNLEEILYVDFRRSNNINDDSFFDNTFTSLELNPFGLTNNSDITGIIQKDNAPSQRHTLNVSGGKEDLRFNLVASFFDEEGLIVNSGFQRFSIRSNTTYEKGKLKLTSGINLRMEKQNISPNDLLLRAYRYKPYQSQIDVNADDIGDIGGSNSNNDASFLGNFAKRLRQRNIRETDDFNFNLRMDYKITEDLTFTSRANFNRRNILTTRIDPLFRIFTDDGEEVITDPRSGARFSHRRRNAVLFENFLTYNKYFGDHHLTATGIFTAEEATTTDFFADGRDFLNNVVENLGGITSDDLVGGSEFKNSIIGTVGRLQYDYKGKYFLSGLVRLDGSSRFPKENRFVPLPSGSAAWIVSKENFWESMGSSFNFLKLRFSYGTVGNQFVGDFEYQPVIQIDRDAVFGDGTDERLSIGQIQTAFRNQNLEWERKVESNFGIEMGFFDNKLTIETDIYDGTRTDMLFDVTIPPSTGPDDTNVTLNVGDMRNYGVEVAANYNHRSDSGDFRYTVGATFSRNENEITRMSASNKYQFLNSEIAPGLGGSGNNDPTTTLREGFEAGAFFLYETDGLITNDQELADYEARFPGEQAFLGDLRLVDQITEDTDGDGIPDAGNGTLGIEDRVYKGSGAPEFELGLNLSTSYKNFDLSMQWYGAFGGEVLNGSKSFAYRAGTHKDLLNAWSLQNPTSTIPADRGRGTRSYRGFSDYFLEDGTFIRLRNIQLGYTVPSKLIEKIGFTQIRLFIAADNPITITDYSGFDPEAGAFDQFNENSNGLNRRGIDSGNYPISSELRAGIQLKF